jgi:hypothetical protein
MHKTTYTNTYENQIAICDLKCQNNGTCYFNENGQQQCLCSSCLYSGLLCQNLNSKISRKID